MHCAKLNKSDRLKRVAKFLDDRKKHSTLEIIKGANVCAVNSIVSELRANGLDIDCSRKGDVWFYKLRSCGRGG
jgi:hypothetical protein